MSPQSSTTTAVPRNGIDSRLMISLVVIVLSWVYQLSRATQTPEIPATFPVFMALLTLRKLATVGVVWLLLRNEGERVTALGLSRDQWLRRMRIGVGLSVPIFLLTSAMLPAVLASVFPKPVTEGPTVMGFFADPKNLLLLIPMGVIGGGVVEEIERIFILTRFEKWRGQRGLIAGLILSSLFFGVGHLYQGIGGAIAAGTTGLLYGLVYLRKRSAVEAMSAHGFADIIGMVAATYLAQAG